jgi:hypothetical protein
MSETTTMEEQVNEYLEDFLAEAREIQKKYRINKSEALLLMVLFELKKVHSHLDDEVNSLETSKR